MTTCCRLILGHEVDEGGYRTGRGVKQEGQVLPVGVLKTIKKSIHNRKTGDSLFKDP